MAKITYVEADGSVEDDRRPQRLEPDEGAVSNGVDGDRRRMRRVLRLRDLPLLRRRGAVIRTAGAGRGRARHARHGRGGAETHSRLSCQIKVSPALDGLGIAFAADARLSRTARGVRATSLRRFAPRDGEVGRPRPIAAARRKTQPDPLNEQAPSVDCIAFIGFGEAAQAFSTAGGARDFPSRVLAYDIKTDSLIPPSPQKNGPITPRHA